MELLVALLSVTVFAFVVETGVRLLFLIWGGLFLIGLTVILLRNLMLLILIRIFLETKFCGSCLLETLIACSDLI